MPINEREEHPFLELQQNSDGFNFNNISKMIIGTFPIYGITQSTELYDEGRTRRDQWNNEAYFNFFYGSRKNHLWPILCNCLNINLPTSIEDCLTILNLHGIFISDCIRTAERREYKSDDKSLINIQLNNEIPTLIQNMTSLNRICFTSDDAKSFFTQLLNINNEGRSQIINLGGNNIELKTLPSPAGNGRTVSYYFNNFPLNVEEQRKRDNSERYALQYRERIYRENLF